MGDHCTFRDYIKPILILTQYDGKDIVSSIEASDKNGEPTLKPFSELTTLVENVRSESVNDEKYSLLESYEKITSRLHKSLSRIEFSFLGETLSIDKLDKTNAKKNIHTYTQIIVHTTQK